MCLCVCVEAIYINVARINYYHITTTITTLDKITIVEIIIFFLVIKLNQFYIEKIKTLEEIQINFLFCFQE